MTLRALSMALALLTVAACSRQPDVTGAWVGSYEPGLLSPRYIDVIDHSRFAIATRNDIHLELREDGRFALSALERSLSGNWSWDGDFIVLQIDDTLGIEFSPLRFSLDGQRGLLVGERDPGGTRLNFRRAAG